MNSHALLVYEVNDHLYKLFYIPVKQDCEKTNNTH